MQGCTLEWRTNFQREATTEDSKRGQSRNTVIRDPRILCTPLSKFLDPPLSHPWGIAWTLDFSSSESLLEACTASVQQVKPLHSYLTLHGCILPQTAVIPVILVLKQNHQIHPALHDDTKVKSWHNLPAVPSPHLRVTNDWCISSMSFLLNSKINIV